MIPIDTIDRQNVYTQQDAHELLGRVYSTRTARQKIMGACRSGELAANRVHKVWFFSGASFLSWVHAHLHDEKPTGAAQCAATETSGPAQPKEVS